MFKKIFGKKEKRKEDSDDEEEKIDIKNEQKSEIVENKESKVVESHPLNSVNQSQNQQENLIQMKKGDYTVHILIEELKNLISIKENQPPIPRVKMTVLGEEQRTSKMKRPCYSITFNEHFYFKKTNLTVEMLDSEKIIIEVYDNNHTKKKDYFGIYELDFGYVYGRPEHYLKNIWIGLSNPESEDITQIRGYLKLSVCILNETDNRVELEPKDNEAEDCLIPIEIKIKYKQISFYFFRGEEFPDMDAVFSEKEKGRRCDGYIEMKYMGIMRKTRVVKMANEIIVWNQIIDIPAAYPCVSQKITILVKDEDDIGGDDIVGSYEFNINDIYAGKYNNLRYINIYGSPLNKRGGIFDQMNYNAEIGSRWNGRVLMKCTVNDIESPIASVRDIDDKNLIREISQRKPECKWVIYARIISAYFLPELEREYSIRIRIQDKTAITRKQKTINSSVDFNETISLQYNSFSNDTFSLPDIFIYLVDPKQSSDKKNICFQRIKASEFHLNQDVLYIKLLPDPAIKKVKSMMKSGILKCKIYLYNQKDDPKPNLNEFNIDGSERTHLKGINNIQIENLDNQRENPMKNYAVVAAIYMSKGLVAAESNGTSDPFVTLTLGNEVKQTSIKNSTMNGVWNELLLFHVFMDKDDQTTWPVFLLNVFDYNKIKSNVPLGYNYLWLCNTHYSFEKYDLLIPKWHKLYLPKSNKQQGEILISFYIFEKKNIGFEDDLLKKIRMIPDTKLYNFEINVLGLRELKPLGLIEVKKPFIKFDLNSLNVTGDVHDEHPPIQTIPVNGGANPTINTVIQFQTKLPMNILFLPELQCEVYDNILNGLSNSLLGVFTIDLKRIIRRTHKQIDEDINEVKKNIGMNIFGNMLFNQLNIGNNNNMRFNSVANPNIIENSNENIISTSSKNQIKDEEEDEKEEVLRISKSLNEKENNALKADSDDENEKFLEEDENKFDDGNKGQVDLTDKNFNNIVVTLPQKNQKLSMRNTIKLTGDFLKNNINDSNYFVVYPYLKPFIIPGYKSYNDMNNENEDKKIQKDLFIEDVTKAPDPQLFFQIGYLLKTEEDVKPQDLTKHYRRIFRCPLENVEVPQFSMKTPFNVLKVRRGKFVDKKPETELFDAMKDIKSKIIYRFENKIGERSTIFNDDRTSIASESSKKELMNGKEIEKSYGKFKGLIRITESEKLENYEKEIKKSIENCKYNNAPCIFKNYNKYNDLRQKILNKKEVIIRVYILELNELAKKDLLSESDPYIKIYLNDKLMVNEKKNHQNNMKNCKWYKYYDIFGEMPGSSNLKIEVLDYDDVLSDDLIGSTIIDLEDRYFNCDWQDLVEKPVEVRPLLHSDLNGAQGQIYLWLEIFDVSQKSSKIPWKIAPEPIIEMQVRFVVWETEDMEMMDIEDTSDLYVISYFNQKEIHRTDTHFRCQTGSGSFNWRMLIPLRLPVQKPILTLQVYDKDLFASDDYISGATLNLKHLLTVPKYLDLPIKFTRDYYNEIKSKEEKRSYGEIEFMDDKDDEDGIKFWVQCYKGKKEVAGEGEKSGRVLCSLDIFPKALADAEPLGKGRDEPNMNPYLPPPVGRLEFTLNPCKMINQCIGPKFRRKCYCFCLLCIIIIYLIYAMPTMISKLLVG